MIPREAMTPDIDRLLAAERSAVDVPLASHARVRQRLETTLGIALGASAVVASAGAAGAIGQATKQLSWFARFVSKPWRIAIAAFTLGGAAGAGVHALVAEARPTTSIAAPADARAAPPDAPRAVATSPIETPAMVIPAPTLAPVAPTVHALTAPTPTVKSPPSVAAASPSSPSALAKDTTLAAERSLLEVARTALSRGESEAAMASLNDHQTRFPFGQLTEEREALYVQALARAGRRAEAIDRGARFKRNFPLSMLLPVVEAATE